MENISLVIVGPPPTLEANSPPARTKSQRSSTPNPPVKYNRSMDEPGIFLRLASAGTAACIADAITFPLDTAKVRLQIQGEGLQQAAVRYNGIAGTLYKMATTEGLASWYKGIAAGMQRQMAFASIRIGLYENVKNYYVNLFNASRTSAQFGCRVLAGVTTGGFAVLCAQPTDLVKVRLQAQQKAGHIRYLGTMHAYRTIAVEEGLRGLWRGTVPNVARNSIVNVTELVAYDVIKEFVLKHKICKDNISGHVVCGFGAGLCTTLLGSPIDVVKTRFMNAPPNTYTGVINCAVTMASKEGPQAFYKGVMPSFLRFVSWSILMFVTYEEIKSLVKSSMKNRNSNSNNNIFCDKSPVKGLPSIFQEVFPTQHCKPRYN